MIEKFFFGGLTPSGFSTQLTQIGSSKEYSTYILKGGPGTGKSQMMKKIAERFANSENVTCFHCSSDPDSLDAVMLHTSHVMIVDGTSPHISEPRYPGVRQELVDLGQYWNKAILKANGEKIIEATELNKSMMAGAANYIKALGLLCDDTYTCAAGLVDRQRIEQAARSFCDSLFENRESKTGRGQQAMRQLSVMTRYGYTTLRNTAESYRKLYILNDNLFAASSMFIECAAAQAMDHGYDIKLSPCLLSEIPISEHLLIDEISTALITSNPLTQLTYAQAEHVDCSAFYDADRMQPHEKHFAANHSLIGALADATREMLDDAKRVHDEMERYYTNAMDFDALDSVCDKICDEIKHRESQ